MDTKTLRFIFILTILNAVHVYCDGSDKRFLKQLRNFKRKVREDLTYIVTDISTLFHTVDDFKKSGTIAREDPLGNKNIEQGGKCAVDCKEVTNEISQVNAAILKALETEKRINRQLQNKLQVVENVLSDIAMDMEKFVSFMAYVNDTLQNPVTERPKDYTDLSGKATVTVTPTENIKSELDYEYVVYDSYGDYYESMPKDTTTVGPLSTRNFLFTSYCAKADRSGVFDIYLEPINMKRTVYCDANTDGGGWIVIMRRQDGSVDFDRKWDDYKNGFGNIDGEYWIGNDLIHTLTKSKSMELRIDMEDFDGNKAYAKYSHFEIGPESENYILNVGGYSGTAGDSLENASYPSRIHNGMAFSTRDKDNDLSKITHCAAYYEGGWWFNACSWSLLNGNYGGKASFKKNGIFWSSWTQWGINLKYVDMKVR